MTGLKSLFLFMCTSLDTSVSVGFLHVFGNDLVVPVVVTTFDVNFSI